MAGVLEKVDSFELIVAGDFLRQYRSPTDAKRWDRRDVRRSGTSDDISF